MTDCLFCNIAQGKMDTIFLYEDDDIVIFKDIDPQAPLHLLVVPKEHIDSAAQLTVAHGAMLGKAFEQAARLVAEAVQVPIIASGGAGSPAHMRDALVQGRASAALIASIVHYGEYTIQELKDYLHKAGCKVRLA